MPGIDSIVDDSHQGTATVNEPEVLVLGGGLAGLAVAAGLGPRACVLESASRPGGLVRSFQRDGWWFDYVLHLLHFNDEVTKKRLLQLLDGLLEPCPPDAYVTTTAGVARFPIQEHLGQLEPETAIACLDELARGAYGPAAAEPPRDYRELLLRSFGPRLCELFFFPYNAKMWRAHRFRLSYRRDTP